jgi:hypothetical protein
MSNQYEDDKNWLEELAGKELPDCVSELPPETLHSLKEFIDEFYEAKMSSVRKAFQANELTLKFMPNFLVYQVIKNFLDPSVAALVAESISVPTIAPIISSLDVEYIANSTIFINSQRAAEILLRLDKRKVKLILESLLKKKPLKVLDIMHHIPVEKYKTFGLKLDETVYQDFHLSDSRKEVLQKLIS